jgi:hypothetical protein
MAKRRPNKIKKSARKPLTRAGRKPGRQDFSLTNTGVVKVRIENQKKISKPIAGPKGDIIKSVEDNYQEEKTEKEKRLFMWIGVSCIMVVFIVIWIFNLKYEFRTNANKSNKNNFNWNQTKAELDKAMQQVKQGIAEIKQIRQTAEQNILPKEPQLTEEQINQLKGKLLFGVASSTATSTKK